MTRRVRCGEFTRWADTLLAGTGWSLATVRSAAERGRDDLSVAALADGFAAAACGLVRSDGTVDGAA